MNPYHDHISPLRVLWLAFWFKPAIDYGRGKISFSRMVWRYISRAYLIFILPLLIYGIYTFMTTPDYVWARPKPTTYEEMKRQEQPSVFESQ